MSVATDVASVLTSLASLAAVAAEHIRVRDDATYQALCKIQRDIFELASLAQLHAEREPTK